MLEGKITGYWIENHKWWSKKHVLPISNLSIEEKQSYFVGNVDPLLPIRSSEKRFLHGKNRLIGRSVRQHDGGMIGIVEDVYFLPDSGKILGYELTEGLFEDVKLGIKVVKTEHFSIDHKDQALVLS